LIKNILIYNSGGGLGDSIQLMPVILSLQNYFKNSQIFYISAHGNHYNGPLKEYNIKIKTFDLNLKYFGFRWWHFFRIKKELSKQSLNKFDLIIDLQSKLRNTLILKKIPHNYFYSSTYNFFFSSNKRNYSKESNLANMTLNNLNKFLNVEIKKIDYDLSQLPDIYIKEAKRLLPKKNYIGLSVTQGNMYRKKSWPIENFIELASKIKENNKIPVFFIEKKNIEMVKRIETKISDAIFPEMNSIISCPALVTALSSRLEKAITIDNGVMHMMSLSRVPMVALFGPTSSKKFAPDYKVNKILDSKEIYKSNDITKITVLDVFKFI
jgi:ADP-heptose:LPS heptosyltransferase